MNKELNTQIETMLADFNKRQEEILNEISNLKKSTNAIKENVLKQYEILEPEIIKTFNELSPLFNMIHNNVGYIDSNNCNELNFFSVFNSDKGYSSNNYLRVETRTSEGCCISVKIDNFRIYVKNNSLVYKGCYYGANDGFTNSRAEYVLKYFSSGLFEEHVIEVMREFIKRRYKELEYERDIHKRIIENAEPISKESSSNWSDYIMYLLKWSSEHADKSFSGMSPACYDEWLDNEMEE